MTTETDPLLGQTIDGKYLVERVLGYGGMGVVYAARDVNLGRSVALKTMKAQLLDNPAAVERFKQEAAALGTLSHPNIVTVYSVGSLADGGLYIAMELLQGQSLYRFMHGRTPMSWQSTLSIIAQIAEALDAAHTNPMSVLHRDLKPDNVMILEGKAGGLTVKLVDFGLAKLKKPEQQQFSQTVATMGTPGYMSPEHLLNGYTDGRSDLYALGVIWFEMLTGKQPFEGETPYVVLQRHMEAAPAPDVTSLLAPGTIDIRIADIVKKLLAKDLNQRVQSADDLLALLKPLLETTRPVSPVPIPVLPLDTSRPSAATAVEFSKVSPVAPLSAQPAPLASAPSTPSNPSGTLLAPAPVSMMDVAPVPPKPAAPAPPASSPYTQQVPVSPRAVAGAVEQLYGPIPGIAEDFPTKSTSLSQSNNQPSGNLAKNAQKNVVIAAAAVIAVVLIGAVVFWMTRPKPPQVAWLEIAAGNLQKGCVKGDTQCALDEKTGTTVAVAAFRMMAYEVSVEDFRRCIDAGVCSEDLLTMDDGSQSCNIAANRTGHPANCVNAIEAGAFCRYIGSRLPTSQEWEYVAKGGENASIYPWGNTWKDPVKTTTIYANFCEQSCDRFFSRSSSSTGNTVNDQYMTTAPFNAFLDGVQWRFGAANMAGNVAELVTASAEDQSKGQEIRGGSWRTTPASLRNSAKEFIPADSHRADVGFRCVQDYSKSK